MLAMLLGATLLVSTADARTRSRHPPELNAIQQEAQQLRRDLAVVRDVVKELKAIREQIRGPNDRPRSVVFARDMPAPDMSIFSVEPAPARMASLTPVNAPEPKVIDRLARVYPCDCTQRGQFREQRRTHRHAGLDLGGELGSPILAAYAGVVLPAPGGDRGYGPIVRVIRGDDGIAYRYAHLNRAHVKIGERVATGDQIGTMGKVGRHGMPHLHFEMIPWNEYKRHAYGVHSLDPNSILKGHRGHTMVAGLAMPVATNVQFASLGEPIYAERTRIRRRHHVRHKRYARA